MSGGNDFLGYPDLSDPLDLATDLVAFVETLHTSFSHVMVGNIPYFPIVPVSHENVSG